MAKDAIDARKLKDSAAEYLRKLSVSTRIGDHSIRSSELSANSTANFCSIWPTKGISAWIFQ